MFVSTNFSKQLWHLHQKWIHFVCSGNSSANAGSSQDYNCSVILHDPPELETEDVRLNCLLKEILPRWLNELQVLILVAQLFQKARPFYKSHFLKWYSFLEHSTIKKFVDLSRVKKTFLVTVASSTPPLPWSSSTCCRPSPSLSLIIRYLYRVSLH